MKLIQQPNKYSCFITSLYMLNNGKDYKKIKSYCKKYLRYSPSRDRGCDVNPDTICAHLANIGLEAYISPNAKNMTDATKFNKALVIFVDRKHSFGHAMAWDGYKFFDPGAAKPGKYLPSELPYKYYRKSMRARCVVIKTHPLKRFSNMIKKLIYNLLN